MNFLIGLFIGAFLFSANISSSALYITNNVLAETISNTQTDVLMVPFYSQFSDIHSAKWQKLGCGITSLAMLIDFYRPGVVSVDTLLKEGLAAGAFVNGVGWKHGALAFLTKKYGLKGTSYDLSHLDINTAFAQFKDFLKEGPVIASVHYKFDPKNPIPHLVVINNIDGDNTIYYNDPAGVLPGKTISVPEFIKAWKKRFIVIRPK